MRTVSSQQLQAAGRSGVEDEQSWSQALEQTGEFLGFGGRHDEALADARGDVGGGEPADFGEHRIGQLLGLVDEQQGPHAGVVEMGEPALAKIAEPAPAVAGHELDAEHRDPVKMGSR